MNQVPHHRPHTSNSRDVVAVQLQLEDMLLEPATMSATKQKNKYFLYKNFTTLMKCLTLLVEANR